MKTISAELQRAMKKLSLGKILDALPQRIALAEKDAMPIDDFLLMVFTDEVERRREAASARRADQAGLDPSMVMERWDKTAKVTFDRRVLHELCTLRFVAAHRNVVALGPVGVGKTFIASALGHLACGASFRVRLVRADALLRSLRQSRLDNSRDALMTELCTIALLIIDDFALEPMSREESRDVYQLFIERKRPRFNDCHQQSRHRRLACRLRRCASGTERRRSIQEQRVRLRRRWRVVSREAHVRYSFILLSQASPGATTFLL